MERIISILNGENPGLHVFLDENQNGCRREGMRWIPSNSAEGAKFRCHSSLGVTRAHAQAHI